MTEIKMNDSDLREIASALRYLEGRDEECSSNRRMWGQIAGAIEEQIPRPAIEEPMAFGSVIRATGSLRRPLLWQQDLAVGEHYWRAQDGQLRVGLEEPNGDEWRRLDLANAETDAYANGHEQGRRVMNTQIHARLTRQLSEAITAEQKCQVEKAIQAVEDLAP